MNRTTTGQDFRHTRPAQRPAHVGALIFGLGFMLVLVVLGPFMTTSDLPFTGEGNPVRQGAYLLAALIVAFGLRLLDVPTRLLAVPLPIVIALGVCLLSITWAIEPGVGLRRLVLTALVVWTVCASARQLGFETTLKLVRIILAIALAANFAAALGWPQVGIHQADTPEETSLVGDWRGIMVHKNFAGAICAITILLFTFAARAVALPLRVAVVVGAAIFLWLSQSKTSGGMTIAALAIALLYLRYSSRYRVAVMSVACLAAAAGAVFVNIYNEPIGNLVTDPRAFTGRTLIWRALTKYSADNPWLGSGFGSFWDIGAATPIHKYAHGWVEAVTSAHNGFLELIVEVGWPATVVIVVCLVLWPLGRLIASSAATGERGALLLSAMMFCVGHNMTESSMLQRDSLVQVTLTLAIVLLWNLPSAALQRSGRPIVRATAQAPRRPRGA